MGAAFILWTILCAAVAGEFFGRLAVLRDTAPDARWSEGMPVSLPSLNLQTPAPRGSSRSIPTRSGCAGADHTT